MELHIRIWHSCCMHHNVVTSCQGWRGPPGFFVATSAAAAAAASGQRRRPCIVLDELDGAAGGAENHSAVAALVKLITGVTLRGECRGEREGVMVVVCWPLNQAGAQTSDSLVDRHLPSSQACWSLHSRPEAPSSPTAQHSTAAADQCLFALRLAPLYPLPPPLLSLCVVSPPPSPPGEGGSKKRKRGSKGCPSGGGLSVPVICTANDAYAPCLRPLKDIAALYHFKPPAPDKLAARLAAIAGAEGIRLDKQVGGGGKGGGMRGD